MLQDQHAKCGTKLNNFPAPFPVGHFERNNDIWDLYSFIREADKIKNSHWFRAGGQNSMSSSSSQNVDKNLISKNFLEDMADVLPSVGSQLVCPCQPSASEDTA